MCVYVYASVNMYVGVYVCHGVHVWRPEDNLQELVFPVSWELNPGSQAWQQAPLFAEQSCLLTSLSDNIERKQ